MMERLQKILSARGVASRRHSEELILAGRVTVNGAVARLGDTADALQDQILLDGEPIPDPEKPVYILLHKPRGYVTTLSDEKGRKNAAELVADCGFRVYPVGRLDMDSEGLLLFTNDGALANHLMHPKHGVDKTYHVTVDGFSQETFKKLEWPIVLDGYQIQSPKLSIVKQADHRGRAVIQVVIHEGRNRQVRRMCAAAGLEVRRLVRVAEGSLQLGNLPLGKWRYLTETEIAGLK